MRSPQQKDQADWGSFKLTSISDLRRGIRGADPCSNSFVGCGCGCGDAETEAAQRRRASLVIDRAARPRQGQRERQTVRAA